ncbi:MAG: hypothetical protein HFF07_03750 [Oscillospiraceae bacterium]|nr:hypothetical protein [Oscillospiraceae bacterium]
MMEGYLLTARGERLELPVFESWHLKRTGGVPCDSFEGVCPWDRGAEPAFDGACRLLVEEGGARRFTGVLDEYELRWDGEGGSLSLSGRGLAALLLDNEAAGRDYQVATLEDILEEHVRPYGIPVGEMGALGAVTGFSVATGSSEWQVLYDFARYHNGVQPRFDVWGSLTVAPGERGRLVRVNDGTGVTGVRFRDKRYGVYSEILVQDLGSLRSQRVADEGFISQGGRCRRVYTMPGRSAYQAMRYSGQFQLDRAREERFRVELTVPGSWVCEPGDQVEVELTRPALRGTWRALETETILDRKGCRVKVTLG